MEVLSSSLIGVFAGALITIIVARHYYKRTYKDAEKLVDEFKKRNEDLRKNISELQEWQELSSRMINDTHEVIIRGTEKDPNWPK